MTTGMRKCFIRTSINQSAFLKSVTKKVRGNKSHFMHINSNSLEG